MFSKSDDPQPHAATAAPGERADADARAPGPAGQKLASLIADDMTVEGDFTSGGQLQIDGAIKGDVRVERVTVSASGLVEVAFVAVSVEVRGRVSGAITAKQVRLYGASHVDGDIAHEQLIMDDGAFFEGRALRLQRAAAASASSAPPPRSAEPAALPSAPAPAPKAAPPH